MTIEKKDLVEAIESSQTDPADKVQTYLRNLLVDFVRSWPDSKLVLPGNLQFAAPIVKTCPICGKEFTPRLRNDQMYCDRPYPMDPTKTCVNYPMTKVRGLQ